MVLPRSSVSFLFYMHILINLFNLQLWSDFLKPTVIIPWFQIWSGEHWTNPHFTSCHPLRWSKTKFHTIIHVMLFYVEYHDITFSKEYNLDWQSSMIWTLSSHKVFWECAYNWIGNFFAVWCSLISCNFEFKQNIPIIGYYTNIKD